MNQNYRLTYDFGSGSVKAALFDRQYNLLGSYNAPYPTYFPENGWAEQKPEEQWEAMILATKKLLEKTGADAGEIAGIAPAQTATSVIFTDENGTALHDCVMWMDGRAGRQADKINWRLGEERFSGKNVISKLLWFEENEPQLVEKAAWMLDFSAWLFRKMTGEFAYEFTGARATCLVDIEHKCWDQKMFDLIGFPRRLVPERIAQSTDRIGILTEEAAQQLGLMPGTPVFGGTSDHAAAILGTGCIRPDDAHIYMGTSAWLAVVTDADGPHPGRMPSPVPGRKYHFYDTDSGGVCIDFLIDNFYRAERDAGQDVFRILDSEIEDVVRSGKNEEVIFLPFLAGASAPISDTTVRATLLNLKRSTTRGDIAKAFYEGICYNMRLMYDIHMDQTGQKIPVIRGIGGVFANARLPQTLADVLGIPVVTLKNPRFAGALGLASCIDVGLGDAPDFSILDSAVLKEKSYIPNPAKRQYYERLYRVYKNAFDSLSGCYKTLNG